MTSGQESSPPSADPGEEPGLPLAGVESIGGAYHPHLIEVQDFEHYGLIVDLRTAAEYAADRVPGAVQLDPSIVGIAEPEAGYLADAAEHRSQPADGGGPVLVYCRDGGTASGTFAERLRARGREVDVMPGGWASYRRWVIGGLNLVPRLLAVRVVCSPLRGECACVLQALRDAGEQVLDLCSLAGWRGGQLDPLDQPSQHLFESRLLAALRQLRGDCVVYVADADDSLGGLTLPAVFARSLAIAPFLAVEAPLPARVARLRRQEGIDLDALLGPHGTAAGVPPVTDELRARLERLGSEGGTDRALAWWLQEWVDTAHAQTADRFPHRCALRPLRLTSFEEPVLAEELDVWMRESDVRADRAAARTPRPGGPPPAG